MFKHHEPCPNCGSKDNLARYDDGGAFCFGCHYQERPTCAPSKFLKATVESVGGKAVRPLPDDAGVEYGPQCIAWLSSFYVDVPTAIRRGLVYSPSREQLIFKLGNVWQARNFNEERRKKYGKCYTSGDVNECLHIYGCMGSEPVRGLPLVIVEDPVSALRIAESEAGDAMPLLGSHLATSRLRALAGLYSGSKWVFWLDSDKFKESVAMCDRARLLGLSSQVLYTDEDPKCYSPDKLKELLT